MMRFHPQDIACVSSIKTTRSWLLQLDDELLHHLFSFLPIPDILAFRQSCRRVWDLFHRPLGWLNAYKLHILKVDIMSGHGNNRPWSLSPEVLAKQAIHAHRIAQNLKSSNPRVWPLAEFTTAPDLGQIKLIESGGKVWLVTWDNIGDISIWDCTTGKNVFNQRLTSVDPQDAGISKITIHTNQWSETMIATHFAKPPHDCCRLFTITSSGGLEEFEGINGLSGDFADELIAVYGDILVLRPWFFLQSVIIRNWKTQEQCELRYDGCDQQPWSMVEDVFFLPGVIIVKRSQSASAYISPPFMTLPEHEMSWHFPCSSVTIPEPSTASLSWHRDDALPSLLLSLDDSLIQLRIVHDAGTMVLLEHIYYFAPLLVGDPSISTMKPLQVVGHNGTVAELIPIQYGYGYACTHFCILRIITPPGHLNASHQVQVKVSHQLDKNWVMMDYNDNFGIIAVAARDGLVKLFRLWE